MAERCDPLLGLAFRARHRLTLPKCRRLHGGQVRDLVAVFVSRPTKTRNSCRAYPGFRHFRPAFGCRKDHDNAGSSCGTDKARCPCTRRESGPRLYRSGVSCRSQRIAKRQSQYLGDAARGSRQYRGARRGISGDRRRHGVVRWRADSWARRRNRGSCRPIWLAGDPRARHIRAGAIRGGGGA